MEQKNETNLFSKLKDLIEKIKTPVLTELQKKQSAVFLCEVLRTNEIHNLTAITDPEAVVSDHLLDSLAVMPFIDFSSVRGIVDVGTGAGFPGIPLKICHPDIPLFLIEVNKKKIAFLDSVISGLSLENVTICPYDWRTFLRKTTFDANLFLSRASLPPAELLRMFKPSVPYREAMLVYFASTSWKPLAKETEYLFDQKTYTIKNKERIFAFFRAPDQQKPVDNQEEDVL